MVRTVKGLMLAAAVALALGAGTAEAKGKTQLKGIVNLNTATASQLDLLPGVGEKAAKAIITYRQKQPFGRIEDLVKVKGFGKKRFEKMKPFLATFGANTLQAVKTKPDGDKSQEKKGGGQARSAPPSH